MKKVCFVCNWGETSFQLFDRYSNQTPNCSGEWGNIKGVIHPQEADYFAVMDGGIGNLDRSKVLFFQREPPSIKGQTEDLSGVKFKGTYDTTPQASIWWVKKNYDELKALKNIPKREKVSCVMSGKTMCEGHRNRLERVKEISDNIDVNFYGRGLDRWVSKGYQGEVSDKFNALYPYTYSFVFENSNIPNYFTEKICDSFLTYTMPLYNGCTNLEKYFPKESFIDIRGKSIQDIKEIVNTPLTKENIDALEESKRLVLDKYNIWAMVEEILDA